MSNFEVTLPVSGVTLHIRRQPMSVVQNLQLKAMQMHEQPKPPMMKEEVAPDTFVERENINDVSYINAVQQYELSWKQTFGKLLMTVLAKTCIVQTASFEKILNNARDMQLTYQSIGLTVPEDIVEFAIEFMICVSEDDMNYLMMEVFGKTLPTQQQVAMRAAMFQGQVQTS